MSKTCPGCHKPLATTNVIIWIRNECWQRYIDNAGQMQKEYLTPTCDEDPWITGIMCDQCDHFFTLAEAQEFIDQHKELMTDQLFEPELYHGA